MNNSKTISVPKSFIHVMEFAEEKYGKNLSRVMLHLLADYVEDDMKAAGVI